MNAQTYKDKAPIRGLLFEDTMELFKKGQIIPKRLGVLHVHKKVRHSITFGCDVWAAPGKEWVAVPGTGNCLVHAKGSKRIHRNGTKQEMEARFVNLWVDLQGIDYAIVVDHSVEVMYVKTKPL
jgi:hypothetical protein